MEFGQLQSQAAHSLTRASRNPRGGPSIPANDVTSIIEFAHILRRSDPGDTGCSGGYGMNRARFAG